MKRTHLIRTAALLLAALLLHGNAVALPVFSDGDDQDKTEALPMENALISLDPGGYVGSVIQKNIGLWQTMALEKNPNIVEAIASANGALRFDALLGTDWYGVDNYFAVDVVAHGTGRALAFRQKKASLPTGSFDRDVRFGGDLRANTDWTGAKRLFISLDASERLESTLFRVAFEENTVGRESYEPKSGAEAQLFTQGQDGLTATGVKIGAGGYVSLPAGFTGLLSLPLNTGTFRRYFAEGGNGKMDLDRVMQFQFSVRGGAADVGHTLYITGFSASGEGFQGDASPVDGEYLLPVWTFEGIAPKSSYTGSVTVWYGEFVGKLLTGMAYCYKVHPDEELKKASEKIVAELASAQGEDGYLGVFTGGARFSLAASNWDLWNHYHCVVGLLEWYKLTADDLALQTAKKALDLILQTFRDRSYLVGGGFETNRAIAHGFALMYEITRDGVYLDEAQRIIEQDCSEKNGWYKTALAGKDFYTSDCGRWEVLHMIMTLGILYRETGKEEYLTVMRGVWESILRTDVHNSGGFTTNEGAQGDPYMNGVIETCCTVAWMAFSVEYYRIAPQVRIIDEIERSYFNGMLGSVLDDGIHCTYNTPMNGIAGSAGSYDGRRAPSQRDISFQYNSGSPDMNCCQANLARGLGQISEWAALSDGRRLYINYYGASELKAKYQGEEIVLKQETDYPVSGRIRITVACKEDLCLPLSLRIPGWAGIAAVTKNGERRAADAGTYLDLDCQNGDEILIELPLHVTTESGAGAQKGRASLFWGPVLLALDDTTADPTLSFDKIKNAQAQTGGGELLRFETGEDGGLTLISFSDAGKTGDGKRPRSYRSFLKIDGAPEENAGVPWQTTRAYPVFFGERLHSDFLWYEPGERVTFRCEGANGEKTDSFISKEVVFAGENGGYSFVMPGSPVRISAHFVSDDPPTPTPTTPTESQDTGSPGETEDAGETGETGDAGGSGESADTSDPGETAASSQADLPSQTTPDGNPGEGSRQTEEEEKESSPVRFLLPLILGGAALIAAGVAAALTVRRKKKAK